MEKTSEESKIAAGSSSRKERREKFWAEKKKKKREERREGLRKITVPQNKPDKVDSTPATESRNKGGFKTSATTRMTLSVEMKSQTKLNFKRVKANTENSKKVMNNDHKNNVKKKQAKTKPAAKIPLPNVHIAGEQSPSKHMVKSYVLFVGNLPYDITKEQLEEHFRKTGGVKAIRIPKEKGTDKARGFAYIEFKDRISHGIALRLHQTTLSGRKINVEFTSIGGNNKVRLDKLKLKNLSKAKFKMPLENS